MRKLSHYCDLEIRLNRNECSDKKPITDRFIQTKYTQNRCLMFSSPDEGG